jgi:hypothetical protein
MQHAARQQMDRDTVAESEEFDDPRISNGKLNEKNHLAST